VTLNLKATAKAARFEYTDGSMEVSWTVDGSLTDEELVERLRSIVAFMDAQTGGASPSRLPGFALGMAQEAHPAMTEAAPAAFPAHIDQRGQGVGNGWAPYAGAGMPPRSPRARSTS
jgi:hypothetical protein